LDGTVFAVDSGEEVEDETRSGDTSCVQPVDLFPRKFPISSGIDERQNPTDAHLGLSGLEILPLANNSDPLEFTERE
jgi:hypothetical protein